MFQNKKLIIILIIVILLVILTVVGIIYFKHNTKIIDVSEAKHFITIEENVDFYKKTKLTDAKIHRELPIGTNIYVLENFADEEGTAWSKVVIDNKIGYILSEQLACYEMQDDEKVLMVDLSKFNKGKNFDTAGELGAFLINSKISYVYIRAGGRGYGDEGNFYEDPEFKLWADECEFLDIPFGFYFLDEALNSEEIDEEVQVIKEFLNKNKYKNNVLPVALDIEKHDGNGRADADEIWEIRADLVTELVQKLENEDIPVIVYSNAKLAGQYLSSVPVKFWLAYYLDNTMRLPNYWYTETEEEAAENEELMSKMVGWQFTDFGVGRVVPRQVDVSLIYKDFYK